MCTAGDLGPSSESLQCEPSATRESRRSPWASRHTPTEPWSSARGVTRLVVLVAAVVDMTEQLDDPVELSFGGVQLDGGTDVTGAVGYCQSNMREPRSTILVLISDLFEGGVRLGCCDVPRNSSKAASSS